jgi:hypothetical protein
MAIPGKRGILARLHTFVNIETTRPVTALPPLHISSSVGKIDQCQTTERLAGSFGVILNRAVCALFEGQG